MAKETTDVAQQQFAWQTTSNVSKAMIGAGSAGKSRIAAGVSAAWKAKTGSMYSGADTTSVARVLRLFGKDNAAKWYDRFFAKETQRAERASRDAETTPDKIETQIELVTGLLTAQGKRLDAIHGLLDAVASEVTSIRTMLSPKAVVIKGTSGKNRNVQYNPLAPPGSQYAEITSSGALTHKKLSEKDKEVAGRRIALETAKLVLKVMEEENGKVELRKKFAWKEDDERYKVKDPVAELGKKIDHIGEALDEMKKRGGFLTTIMTMIGSALSMLSSFLAPAGLVALAGALGYAVGSYLSEKFKLSERIGDAVDWALNKVGLGNTEKKREREYQDMINSKIADANLKLIGTDWKAVGLGTYERSDGKVFKGPDLPEETKELFRQRGVGAFSRDTPPAPQTSFSSQEPVKGPTGELRNAPAANPEKELLDLIASGEGTDDATAQKKGFASGYDTTVFYGKYGKDFNGKPVSKLTLGELRLMQKGMIEKQKKLGIPADKRSSAAGKYQFTYSTLFGEGGKPGLIEELGIRMAETFSPQMQDRLALALLDKEGLSKVKRGEMSIEEFQEGISGRWASVADPDTNKGKYHGQNARVRNEDIQPVLTSLGKQIDEGSRQNAAANSPANVTVVAPQQQTVVNNVPNPAPPRPVQKANVLANEPSFVRGALGNIPHPTNLR
jgi:hypothetical protein